MRSYKFPISSLLLYGRIVIIRIFMDQVVISSDGIQMYIPDSKSDNILSLGGQKGTITTQCLVENQKSAIDVQCL